MKKIKLIVLGLVAFCSVNQANAQALEQGNILIEGYYGFPNLYTAVFRTAYANSGQEIDLKIGGIGPLGGRFEYMVSDNIGLGLDIGFNNSKVTYSEFDSFDNKTYDYRFSTNKLGIMITFNYHFGFMPDNMDLAVTAGAGYGSRKFNFESTDPNYTPETFTSLIPVAARIGANYRVFFTDNLGVNLGLGLGQGGLVTAGLTFRL